MQIRYAHTNIIAQNWQKLCDFYIAVLNCTPKPPQRDQSGAWLDRGLGIPNAHLKGMHLLLPGHGENGPTLEIYQYNEIIHSAKSYPNKKGYGHLAFEVDDVAIVLDKALQHGAQKSGEISSNSVPGVGIITFIYIYDPEGNLIELQSWELE